MWYALTDDPLIICLVCLLLMPVVIIVGLAIMRWRHRQQRIRQLAAAMGPPTCQRCGYDLRASPDRCPECGAAVSDVDGTIIRYMMRLQKRKRVSK